MASRFVLAAALLGLAACTDPSTNSTPSPVDTAAVRTDTPPDTARPAPLPGPPASDDGPAAPAAPDSAGRRSVYTDLDLARCDVLEVWEAGIGREYKCPGYDGIPVFVTEGDLRHDVDIGVRNEVWTSTSAFNDVGPRVEWRLHDGRPVAAIVRYLVDTGAGDRGEAPASYSRLAVLTIGRAGRPGCLVGWIDRGATPDLNTAARHLADTRAPSFTCPAS